MEQQPGQHSPEKPEVHDPSETVRRLQGRIAARDAYAPIRAAIDEAVARARPETVVELPDTEE